MELVLSVTEAEPVETAMRSGAQLLDSVPVFAPVTRLLHYVWPVQQINRTYQPDEPPVSATHILGFRNAEDQVRFIALSEATAGLILRLQNQCTARQALLDMGTGLTLADQSNLMLFVKEILTDLYRQVAIIGIYTN